MALYVIVGEKLNAAVDPITSPATSPAEDPLYPLSRLTLGRPDRPFRWGSASADPKVTYDLNAVPWPGFELATAPPATPTAGVWTADIGAITRDTSIFSSGAASLKLNNGAAGQAHADFLVRAGEKRQLEWGIYAAGGVTSAIQLQNLHTGRFLRTDGTWGAAQDLDTNTNAEFKFGFKQYVVETVDVCGASLVWLRIIFKLGSSGSVYLDDCFDCPAVDFCGLFGTAQMDPVCVPQLRSSGDNFAVNDVLEATFTLTKPTAHVTIVPSLSKRPRWFQLKLSGTPRIPYGLGELVFGQAVQLTTSPDFDAQVEQLEDQIRRTGAAGSLSARPMGSWARRRVTMAFHFSDATSYQQHRDQVFRRSRGGAFPMILFQNPDKTLGGPLFGRAREQQPFTRLVDVATPTGGAQQWTTELIVEEMPFPRLPIV